MSGQDVYSTKEMRDKQIVRLISKVPRLAAIAYDKRAMRSVPQPESQLSYTENFMYMLDGGVNNRHRPNKRLARALDVMFILHAEHEMNCSTAAARHLTSSGVD